MLTEKDRQYFKKWLTQRLSESLEKTQDSPLDRGDLKDRVSDKTDRASLASDLRSTLRIREREARLTRKIRDALEMLDNGTFGICEECGEEIPLKRLMARPVTTLCIRCKKEQEAKERKSAAYLQSTEY
jgi:DnaK suppressor protein